MPTYGIDVVFRSDTLLWSAQSPTTPNPIAMAFGYSYLPDTGPKAEKGEQCKRRIPKGTNVQFWLFDSNPASTIPPKKRIEQVFIQFRNQDPHSDVPCPFDGWDNGGKTFIPGDSTNPIFGPNANGNSIGTNTNGVQVYNVGKSTTAGQSASYPAVIPGKYEFTIKVTLIDGTLFQVDPEVDVLGE